MKWQLGRRSSNVEDRRGGGGGMGMGLGGMGIGGILLVVVISLLFGKNPLQVLGQVAGDAPSQQAGPNPQANDEASQFVGNIVGSTEDVWGQIFKQSGAQYPPPTLVLFSGVVGSACGRASAAVGPFYCPGDKKVYLDTSFFNDMRTKLGAGGDFAEAYVVAHEVGHHVQTLTGVAGKVDQLRARGTPMEGDNGLSVRLELQADCYAGVWANLSQAQYHWIEPGDIDEALNTASAIGDDRLQQQGQGQVVPDSFTHGSSAQRVRWFRNGFESGNADSCDTFAARQL